MGKREFSRGGGSEFRKAGRALELGFKEAELAEGRGGGAFCLTKIL